VFAYHILLFTVGHRLISELLYSHKNPYSITDFLNAHFLENLLVAFDKVVAVEVVR
jgi:hypothetical protein